MNAALIIKVTRQCNLRCRYCHDWRAATGPGSRMTFGVLAAMTKAVLEDASHSSVDFIWHGGETTVLPIEFYRKAVLLQEHFRRPDQHVRNSIQTNGTRITPEWATFFKTYGFSVGVSLDGPPELHDRQRPFVSGQGSFTAVRRGLNLLREHGVDPGLLMVIDDAAIGLGPDYVFDALVSLGAARVGLLSAKPTNQPEALPGTPTEHYVDPSRMGPFLAGIYDRCRAHGGPAIEIRELSMLEQSLRHGTPQACTVAGGCLGRYYLIEPTGEAAHCDLFVGDARYTLGNVLTDSFAEMRSSEAMATLKRENAAQLAGMRSCPEFAVCNGWCPHERYTQLRHHTGFDGTCCGLRPLIEHVRERSTAAPIAG